MKYFYKVSDYECIRKITAGMFINPENPVSAIFSKIEEMCENTGVMRFNSANMKAWLIIQKEPVIYYLSDEYIYDCQLPDFLKDKFIKVEKAEFDNYVREWENEIKEAKKTPSPEGEAMVVDDIKKTIDFIHEIVKEKVATSKSSNCGKEIKGAKNVTRNYL